mgnify:FL=1
MWLTRLVNAVNRAHIETPGIGTWATKPIDRMAIACEVEDEFTLHCGDSSVPATGTSVEKVALTTLLVERRRSETWNVAADLRGLMMINS